MAQTIVKLKTIEGKHFVDVDQSVELIKKQLETNKSILIVARGIEISRIAVVIRRAEEDCNCVIARMETKNVKEKDDHGKERNIL